MKKSLSILLAFALVFSAFASIVGAQEEPVDIGEKLRSYNILKGNTTDGGLDADKEWKRQDVTVIISRLLGAEEEAKSTEKGHRFSDVTDPHYDGYITWAKVNGYFNGHAEWNFGYGETITNQQFATVMLRVLGYEVAYEDAMQVAIEEGLFPEGTNPADLSIRGDLFAVIDNTLKAENAEGEVLWEALGLEEYEVVEEEEPEVPAFEIASLNATGANKLTVAFTLPVEGNAAFAIKRGSVDIAAEKVEWNEAKTEATITTLSKFIAGTYTVTVSGVELEGANVVSAEIAAEAVTTINILSDTAPMTNAAGASVVFSYQILNQYGEDMTAIAENSLTWTVSHGTPDLAHAVVGEFKIDGPFTAGQNVVVTALHASTTNFVTKTLKVGEVSRVAAINNVTLHHPSGAEPNTANIAEFSIVVDAIDQYGNKVTNAGRLAAETTIVFPNPAIFGIANVAGTPTYVDNTVALTAGAGMPGTNTVTVIANFTAQSQSLPVTVSAVAALDNLVLQSPADLVVQGETVSIPFTAFDQFGNEMSEKAKGSINPNTISITGGGITPTFSYNIETQKAELNLTVTPGAAVGSRIVMAVTPTGKTSQITIDVKAEAKPIAVTTTKNLITNVTIGGVAALTPANLVVTDQYGREMAPETYVAKNFELVVTSNAAHIVVGGGVGGTGTINTANGSATLTGGATNGSATITVTLNEVVNPADRTQDVLLTAGALSFAVNNVAKNTIVDYVVEAPALLYGNSGETIDAAYTKALVVYGTLANGARVAINGATDVQVSFNKQDGTGVKYNPATGIIDARDYDWTGHGDAVESTVTAVIIIDSASGPVNKTQNITVGKGEPGIAAITVDANTKIAAGSLNTANVTALFKVTDQYGVADLVSAGITNIIISDIVDADVVTAPTVGGNGTNTVTFTNFAAGDTFKVTVVAGNGLTYETNVLVTN